MLNNMAASWDEHTEMNIENILLDGHAVVTTMEVTPDFQFYTDGWGVHVRPVSELASWSLQGLPVE